MRNKIKQLLTLALFASMCQIASAYDFEVDGIYYEITSETDHTVSTTYKTKDGNTEYVDVTIPETVQYNGAEYFVTSVGEGSFFKCSNLRSVSLPKSVTSIGIYAFAGCIELSSINLPNNLTSIGSHAFEACQNLTSLTIPKGITSIQDYTFNCCSSLTSVELPEGVTSIGDNAFCCCSSLSTINIPASVTDIRGNPFWGCESLPVIDGIRYADTYLVESIDPSVSSVVIKDGTRFIGGEAFNRNNLITITIPNSVIGIEVAAFSGCI